MFDLNTPAAGGKERSPKSQRCVGVHTEIEGSIDPSQTNEFLGMHLGCWVYMVIKLSINHTHVWFP